MATGDHRPKSDMTEAEHRQADEAMREAAKLTAEQERRAAGMNNEN